MFIVMLLEVRHLKLIRAIHAEETLTRAGSRLNLSQSALSHQLKNLEDRLGARLFERRGRKLVITAAGERLLLAAESVLGELQRVEQEIGQLATSPKGVLRLTTQCYTCYGWLPRVLNEFQGRYPRIEIQVELAATRKPLEALLDGRLDLAIVNERVADKRVQYRLLFGDELLAIVPHAHPWARRPFIPVKEFAGECLLLHTQPHDSGFVQRILKPEGVEPRRIQTLQLTEAILEMVKSGRGVSAMARWAIAEHLKRREFATVRIGAGGVKREWLAATLAHRPKARYFDDLLKLLAKEAPLLTAAAAAS